jgi:membrane protease YdiL (CAAX protease family)
MDAARADLARGSEGPFERLAQVPFFSTLPTEALASLEAACARRPLARGERVVREGDPSTELLVLLRGRAESRRREEHRPEVEHVVGELGPGAVIGEVGFFDRLPRGRSVVMVEDGEALALDYAALDQTPAVRDLLGARLATRVRAAGASELESERRRHALGELVVNVIVLLCGYAVLVAGLPRLRAMPSSSSWVSLPLVALMGLGSLRFVRNTGFALDEFGLGRRALLPSLLESLLFTPPFCAALVGLKWLLLQSRPAWRALPLFEHLDWRERLAQPAVLELLAIYLASAIAQELAVRCAVQAGLESFLLGRARRWRAVFVAALMFSINHLHMSFLFAAFALIPGLFWGWLFARRRHLIGPTLSHFVVGAFLFFVLGVSLP